MGYYVRKLAWKKSSPKWKLQYISYKKSDAQKSKAKKPKKEWDISRERWSTLGFHRSMTLEEARSRAKQLNAQIIIKNQEERLRAIELAESSQRYLFASLFCEEFLFEFESRFIRARDSETESGRSKTSRAKVIWKAAQKMIITIGYEPSEWFCHTYEIYDYFHSKQYSIRYIHKIIKLANLWGFFVCKKLARPFLSIPSPRGYERQRLIDAFYKKERRGRKASAPLTPKTLMMKKGNMNQHNFNWLLISVWLGLRPKEVDNLHQKRFWKVETLGSGLVILWVYQTKIIALPPEDRWKPIPLLLSSQTALLKVIESEKFKRPLMKTMRRHFGDNINLYGGRKGFTDLMLGHGQSLENISVWMGHSSISRTWESYKSRRRFHLNPANFMD